MAELNLDSIRHALRIARERGFAEVALESDDSRFEARLDARAPIPSYQAVVAQLSDNAELLTPGLAEVASPCVGYFQESKQPLLAGMRVEIGDVVASITALGLANDVECQQAGEIVDVLVRNGDPVEYGQVLARLRSDA